MNIVFDTNVLISAFVFGGNSGKVFEYCIEKEDVYISQWIINEFTNTLKNKFKIASSDVLRISTLLKSELYLTSPHTKLPSNCRDKDDNHILQLADSINAHYIITGDKDLLVLRHFKDVKILTPKEFLEITNS